MTEAATAEVIAPVVEMTAAVEAVASPVVAETVADVQPVVPAEVTVVATPVEPVVVEAPVVVAPAPAASVETPAAETTPAPKAKANRYGNMVVATMTKPVAVADETPAAVPQGVQYEVKTTVEGSAGSASARQSAVAPMTKPPSVE
ncbi:MAG: hypothetical protein U5L02_10555 [Rheinheimera sp.]|nr:hypothetical protein [Rheinheimera sp.]